MLRKMMIVAAAVVALPTVALACPAHQSAKAEKSLSGDAMAKKAKKTKKPTTPKAVEAQTQKS